MENDLQLKADPIDLLYNPEDKYFTGPLNRFLKEVRREPGLELNFNNVMRGSETNVIPAVYNGQRCVLRVGGMEKREIKGLTALAGIEGIPRLHKVFMKDDEPLAWLVDYVEGVDLPDFLLASNIEDLLKLEERMIALVHAVHSRGYLMPDDWMKKGNIFVTSAIKPVMIDLGASRPMPSNKRQAEALRARDISCVASVLTDSKISIEGISRWVLLQTRLLKERFNS